MIVVDVGACIGQMVPRYLGQCTAYYAFEPMEDNIDTLKQKFGPCQNFHLIEKAVSNYTGTTTIFVGSPEAGGMFRASLTGYEGHIVPDVDPRECEVIKLSDYWKEHINEDVDILKISVVGADYDILEDLLDAGIINRFQKIVFSERGFHRAGNGPYGRIGIPRCQEQARVILPRLVKEYIGNLRYGNARKDVPLPDYLWQVIKDAESGTA